MSIYEKTNVARALLYWAKNNNGNECYYLEDIKKELKKVLDKLKERNDE